MNNLNIGQIITTEQHRDAIHIAVAPVTAGEKLSPGDHIGLLPNGTAGEVDTPIGVVDPFLRKCVKAGEQFWMMLYPGTITSLRHEWIHPAFGPDVRSVVNEHEQWIRQWCQNGADGMDYDDIMQAAKDYADTGEYLEQGGRFEGMGVPAEFWDHYEAVTGTKVTEGNRGSFFSCSC